MSRKPPRTGARRRARECALQVLYQLDGDLVRGVPVTADDAVSLFFAHFEPAEILEAPEAAEYTGELVRGVLERLAEIDGVLQRSTQHWRLERMARVDRNILRMATWELLFRRDVPGRVVLNEAIEVAKKFGTEESGAFVNGVLDRVAQDLGRQG